MTLRKLNKLSTPGLEREQGSQVLRHYESQTEDEAVAEDEAAFRRIGRTVMVDRRGWFPKSQGSSEDGVPVPPPEGQRPPRIEIEGVDLTRIDLTGSLPRSGAPPQSPIAFSHGPSTQSTRIIRGMDRRTFEGRWEDCVLHAPEFAGRRVRITVLEEEDQAPPNQVHPNDDMLAVLRRAKDRAEKIPQTGSTVDSLNLLREGRAGKMFGYEPTE